MRKWIDGYNKSIHPLCNVSVKACRETNPIWLGKWWGTSWAGRQTSAGLVQRQTAIRIHTSGEHKETSRSNLHVFWAVEVNRNLCTAQKDSSSVQFNNVNISDLSNLCKFCTKSLVVSEGFSKWISCWIHFMTYLFLLLFVQRFVMHGCEYHSEYEYKKNKFE